MLQFTKRSALTQVGLLIVLAATFGCGGGGGGGGGTLPTATCIDFIPTAASPSSGAVVMQKVDSESTCDVVTVDVIAQTFSDVFETDFTLTSLGGLASLMATPSSDLLSEGGTVTVNIDSDPAVGQTLSQLEVGVARIIAGGACGTPQGVDASASETRPLARLKFSKVAAGGSMNLTFSTSVLRDSHCDDTSPACTGSNPPATCGPQPITTPAWQAGMLVVN